jgi:hypothetical protein
MEQIIHETNRRYADFSLRLAISARRLCKHSQVSNRNTREIIQHGASFFGKPSILWRGKAHDFAWWPISRRDQFPSPKRPLLELADCQPLRRSQAVLKKSAAALPSGEAPAVSKGNECGHVLGESEGLLIRLGNVNITCP